MERDPAVLKKVSVSLLRRRENIWFWSLCSLQLTFTVHTVHTVDFEALLVIGGDAPQSGPHVLKVSFQAEKTHTRPQ